MGAWQRIRDADGRPKPDGGRHLPVAGTADFLASNAVTWRRNRLNARCCLPRPAGVDRQLDIRQSRIAASKQMPVPEDR